MTPEEFYETPISEKFLVMDSWTLGMWKLTMQFAKEYSEFEIKRLAESAETKEA